MPHPPQKKTPVGTAVKLLLALLLFVGVCEVGIRLSGKYRTLSEKTGGKSLSLFQPSHTGVYNVHPPSNDLHISNSEFTYTHSIDSLGFRNTEIPKDTCAVLALGDSFTEGLGAPQDSTWPALLGRFTRQNVYNAGIMGSDPVYGLKLLKDAYFPFPYRRVLFAVNYSDLTDIVIRGGDERFAADGTVHYHVPPAFMPLYRYSHFFRAVLHLVLGYDYMFNSPRTRTQRLDDALDTLAGVLANAQRFCASRNVVVTVYIHPVPQEYYLTLDRRLDFHKIDELLPRLQALGVDAINLRPAFESRLRDPDDWKAVSWAIDGHFNAKGYALMAQLMAEDLQKTASTWENASK